MGPATVGMCHGHDDAGPAWRTAMLTPVVDRRPRGDALDLVPIVGARGRASRWLGPALSAAILIAALWQLRELDLARVIAMLPRAPLFWLIFAASYVTLPASEWLIYRRLWGVPAAGFMALLRKRVSNDIVLNYSGELYFYAWARRHARLVGSPFGAIKDVAILSASVANVVTLVLIAVSWPLFGTLHADISVRLVVLSAVVMTLPSLLALAFRRRVFTLAGPALHRIAWVHLARIVVSTTLMAMLWAVAMPAAPLLWWLVLATLRLAVGRLPLVPNRDLVFAGLVAFLVGDAAAVTAMLAMVAALTVATTVLLGIALGIAALAGDETAA